MSRLETGSEYSASSSPQPRTAEPASDQRVLAAIAFVLNCVFLLIALIRFSNAGVEVFSGFFLKLIAVALAVTTTGIAILSIRHRHRAARPFAVGGLVLSILSQLCWTTDWAFVGRPWLSDESLRRYVEQVPPNRTEGGQAGLFGFEWKF